MTERRITERTHDRKTFGQIDTWPQDIQPKRRKSERQMNEKQMANKYKIERTFGISDV